MPTILFLCPHHAAKSVLAEAYFNRLMSDTDYIGVSAGTDPDEAVMPSVAELLKSEGIDVSNHRPRHVTPDELATASRIISMGCTPDELDVPAAQIELWSDVPPASQNVIAARDAILAHLEILAAELHEGSPQ